VIDGEKQLLVEVDKPVHSFMACRKAA